ncbi:MAG: toll/interleukin-1 receptor domain-containing protein, partial [Methylococcaceae bacterium]
MNDKHEIFLCGLFALSGDIIWNMGSRPLFEPHSEESLVATFRFDQSVKKRNVLKILEDRLTEKDKKWIYCKNEVWFIELDTMFSVLDSSNVQLPIWLRGVVEPTIEIEIEESKSFGTIKKELVIRFIVTNKEVQLSMPKRIFMSHKGVNKPFVREFFQALKATGFDPWLDEDAMVAGESLERALLKGMKNSCAAVFFITKEYKDENYLATEIDYAMIQKREKGNRFSIITLVLRESDDDQIYVPELLKQYVWKEPTSHLLGF